MEYYLGVDLGASSGKMFLSWTEHKKIRLEEVHRFSNEASFVDKELCWDIDRLFHEILTGMKKCKEKGKIPVSIGVDTWAVDYVLLDKEGKRLGNIVSYRDARTNEIPEKLESLISAEELYRKTGIQKQKFNTIYQLLALKEKSPALLDKAETMLMIPDYIHYLLSGVRTTEYTNSSTTQMVSPETGSWDWQLIDLLGLPRKIFTSIQMAGSCIGELCDEVRKEVGFSCNVILPATHDTASAVLAIPNGRPALYISSGTWSLMGTEISRANCSMESAERNFSNEGGYNYRFRYLKNIMGLWMIQAVRKELNPAISFSALSMLAAGQSIPSMIDCNNERFLAPKSMTYEIKEACKGTNQEVPETLGEFAAVIFKSLAACYAKTAEEIETLTGNQYSRIYVVGGGANAAYLNQLTADYSGKTVVAGPGEGSAIGNLIVQMLENKVWTELWEAKKAIMNSFEIKIYQPNAAREVKE